MVFIDLTYARLRSFKSFEPLLSQEVLVLIARRRESERLGLPLLKRLEAADYAPWHCPQGLEDLERLARLFQDVPEALQRLGKPVSCSSSVRSQRREAPSKII